jgi:CubicO group peptidase (beta-lactamase class C family)
VRNAPVHGAVEPGFESVGDSFVRGLERGELGAAVCAYVDGRKVIDLWGGWADAERVREWKRDTIACTYSAVKGMTATCRTTSSTVVCSRWTNPSRVLA